MNEKYEALHETILCVLHDLVFGRFGLNDDAQRRLLQEWYKQHQATVEDAAKAADGKGRDA